jgi:hypothetical protein
MSRIMIFKTNLRYRTYGSYNNSVSLMCKTCTMFKYPNLCWFNSTCRLWVYSKCN